MDPKEKVKDFNQIFLSLINKILDTSKLAEDVSIEFYTSYFLATMAMFLKREKKNTLELTFKDTS
jgi:hypothetical protein